MENGEVMDTVASEGMLSPQEYLDKIYKPAVLDHIMQLAYAAEALKDQTEVIYVDIAKHQQFLHNCTIHTHAAAELFQKNENAVTQDERDLLTELLDDFDNDLSIDVGLEDLSSGQREYPETSADVSPTDDVLTIEGDKNGWFLYNPNVTLYEKDFPIQFKFKDRGTAHYYSRLVWFKHRENTTDATHWRRANLYDTEASVTALEEQWDVGTKPKFNDPTWILYEQGMVFYDHEWPIEFMGPHLPGILYADAETAAKYPENFKAYTHYRTSK